MTRSRKIDALRRRRDFLNGRIAANPDVDLSFDRAEAAALTWAIEELDALERAYRQACTNLATVRPDLSRDLSVGETADLYYSALRAGWGGIEGYERDRRVEEQDPLTGRCARCGKWYDQHPGGFCPDQVDGAGQVEVGKAEEFVPADDPDAERYARQ